MASALDVVEVGEDEIDEVSEDESEFVFVDNGVAVVVIIVVEELIMGL